MQLEVSETLRDKKRIVEGLARFTGRSTDQVEHDFKRDFYLSAPEAVEYGLVDRLLLPKKSSKVRTRTRTLRVNPNPNPNSNPNSNPKG